MKKIHVLLVMVTITFQQSLLSQIDSEVPVNWSNVGYGGKYYPIPRSFSVFINMKTEKLAIPDDGLDDTEEINAAIRDKIENAPDVMTIFYFPAGVYTLDSSIIIPDGAKNILFLGAGSNYTKFEVRQAVSGFRIYHNMQSPWIDLTTHSSRTSLLENNSTIYIPNEMPVQNGDYIEIAIKMGTWLGKYKNTNPLRDSEFVNDYCVGQISKVDFHFSFPMINLYDVLRMDFTNASLNPKIRKINTVTNIGFENFKIENTCIIPESEIQQDEDDNHLSIHNFMFSYATDCWIWGVESIDPLNSHVSIANSSYIEIRGCYFHEAKGYGGGGHGYGVTIGNHSTNCLVEDNVFDQLRHAMIISSGANGNVFGYNYSNTIVLEDGYDQGDIQIHGNYPFANLFEGNVAQFACADKYWGANGHKNTLFRNRFTKMPNLIANMICIADESEYNGGIRIEDMTEVYQFLHIVGNVVRWGSCPGVKRAQYLPENAVAVNKNNAKFNPDNYNDILEDAGFDLDEGTSYYLSSKPNFLGDYNWPPVGCKYAFGIEPDGTKRWAAPGQNIPAIARFGFSVKTLSSSPIINLYSLTLKNNLDDTENIGNVGAWQKNSVGTMEWSSYPSPATIYLQPNPNQNIRTESDMLSYNSRVWGYNYWSDNSSLINTGRTIDLNSNQSYTALFEKSYPMILVSQLPEIGAQGQVIFRGGTFDSPLSKYGFESPLNTSIGVPTTKTVNNVNYNFVYWNDGISSATRNVSLSAPSTFIANYKGNHVTGSSTALTNTSQRKTVRTEEGYLFLIYESMNRVWLERSTDGGTTWTLCNNGPIDNGPEAKQPSIDYLGGRNEYGTDNELFITYQQKTANGNYTVQVTRFDTYGQKLSDQIIYTSPSSYTNNAAPIVSVTWFYRDGWRKQMVGIWKEPAATGVPAGLYWYPAYYAGSTFSWNDPINKYYQIPNTTTSSVNPALDVYKYDYTARYSGYVYWHFAWEQGGQTIKSQKIVCGVSGLSISGPWPATSIWGVHSYNYRPSIIAVSNTSARLCWNGRLDTPDIDDLSQALMCDPANPSIFWNFSMFVSSATINKYYVDWDNTNGYAVGWTQNYGYASYAAKHTALNNPINLNTSGKDMQLCNGGSDDFTTVTMRGITLTTSLPYAFQQTDAIVTGLQKKSAEQISSGRTGTLSIMGMRFYFTIGDIVVNEEKIDFPEIFDTTRIDSDEQFFNNLISKPFTLNNESSFTYGVQYGVTDSVAAVAAVGTDNYVRFKVELLNTKTGEIIGTFDDVKYNALQIEKYNNIGYTVDTKGINNCTVQLRLSISTNVTPAYSLGCLVSPGASALGKRGTTKKQISYKGTNVVTDYTLEQNFPNPFNPVTTISYALPQDGMVMLKIYDALGREVSTLVNEFKQTGRYTASFDATKLSSGVYIYKLISGNYTATKKMMLIK